MKKRPHLLLIVIHVFNSLVIFNYCVSCLTKTFCYYFVKMYNKNSIEIKKVIVNCYKKSIYIYIRNLVQYNLVFIFFKKHYRCIFLMWLICCNNMSPYTYKCNKWVFKLALVASRVYHNKNQLYSKCNWWTL